MKAVNWLVITNAVKASVYEIVGLQYSLVEEMEHSASRLKSQYLTSDKPGHYQTSHVARGQFISPNDPHKEEHQNFAKELANFLETHREKKHYQRIVICAEPYFYGLLNQAMTKGVHELITDIIKKDYIPLPKAKLNAVIKSIAHDYF